MSRNKLKRFGSALGVMRGAKSKPLLPSYDRTLLVDLLSVKQVIYMVDILRWSDYIFTHVST